MTPAYLQQGPRLGRVSDSSSRPRVRSRLLPVPLPHQPEWNKLVRNWIGQ